MRITPLYALCLTFFFSFSVLFAQKDKGYPAASVGFGYMQPALKGGLGTNLWQGINFRAAVMEINFYSGKVKYKSPSAIDSSACYGFNSALGFHAPILKLAIGNKKYGFMLNPFFYFGVGIMGINAGKKHGDSGLSSWSNSYTAAPGLEFHFPIGFVGLKYCFTYNWYLNDDTRNQLPLSEKLGYEGTHGLMKYPTITLQINSLAGFIHPREKNLGQYYDNGVRNHSETSTSEQYIGNGVSEVTTTTHTWTTYETPGWRTVTSNIVDSYIGLMCGAATQFPTENKGRSFMTQAGLAFRKGVFAIDGLYSFGTLGMRSPDGLNYKNEYKGNIKYAAVAVDVMNLLGFHGNITKDKAKGLRKHPLFMRWLVGYKYGIADLKITYPDTTQIPAGATYHGNQYIPSIYSNTIVRSWYTAIEIGTIGIYWDFLNKKYYPYANGQQFGLIWHLPVYRWNKS